MNLSDLNLPNFALEVLMQIHLAETLDNPIKKGHGWCTARGNSIDAIREILIPKNLVKEEEEYFVVRSTGKQIISLVKQTILADDYISLAN